MYNRDAARPYWKTQSQGDIPLWIPYYFWQQWYPPSKLGGFHAVKNEKSEKTLSPWGGGSQILLPRMGYCLVFANSHVSAMAKAEERFSYDFIWSISRRLTWRKN